MPELAIVGYGKMGKLIEQLAPEYGFNVRLKLDEFNKKHKSNFTYYEMWPRSSSFARIQGNTAVEPGTDAPGGKPKAKSRKRQVSLNGNHR